ncbi:MAG: LptF/LptG family permease [Balneolaceae bacterium]
MINHVQKDLIKKHIGPFFFCFFTVMFLLLMQFLILHVDKLVGKGLPIMIVIELILNNLAYMVVLAVPMSVLIATLIGFGKFSEWNELTALRAAGINPIKLILPILFLGFLLFLFTAYFSNYILPESNHKARSLFIDIRTQKPAFDLQPSTFYNNLEGYTFLIKEIDSENDSLFDVRVIQEASETHNRAFINAEKGWLESPDEYTLSLHLFNGSILRYIPGQNNREETIESSKFSRYRMSFDLSDLAFSRSNPDQRTRTDRTMSAEAMLAVIDTLNLEKDKEYENFRNKVSYSMLSPIKFQESQMFELTEDIASDTLMIADSRFVTLSILPNPKSQISSINRTVIAIDKYRPELHNLKSNMEWRDLKISEFMIEVHKKLSIPFACVVFVLLGAPIGILTRKGNIGVAAIISSVLLTLYFVAIIQGEKLGDRMVVSSYVGMWAINYFYLIIGVILTLHVTTSIRISNLLKRSE